MTYILGRGTVRAGGETKSARNTTEFALLWLVHAVAARSAQTGFAVVVMTSKTTLCANKVEKIEGQ